ncbi:MAG TPA: transposase [Anaerolineae bacterium]
MAALKWVTRSTGLILLLVALLVIIAAAFLLLDFRLLRAQMAVDSNAGTYSFSIDEERRLPTEQHLVDSAYVDAELLVHSRQEQGISLIGPTRQNPSWQAKVEGACDRYHFDVDWDNKQVCCPQGKQSVAWRELEDCNGSYIQVLFHRDDCRPCQARSLCTRSREGARRLRLQPRAQYEALREARLLHDSEAGKQLYNKRAGVEGTISQGVRGFGLRRTRYRGTAKTHLQHVATAAAINIDRIVAWLDKVPRAMTRTSRFAALAP